MTLKNESIDRFNRWAGNYDEIVGASEGFPFVGYESVLDQAFASARVTPGMRVLDLGTGTGNLAGRFDAAGCEVWATDFSEEMLRRARLKYPGIHFELADLRTPLSDKLPARFDRIVSAYALHHLSLQEKVLLIRRVVLDRLCSEGRFLVADIAFETASERQEARRRFSSLWDDEEFYWAADETRDALRDVPVRMDYVQVSCCAGVLIIELLQDLE
jgi:putative AdoMet-dependent methyltransferase